MFGAFQSFDYNNLPDRVLSVAITPYHYIVHEVPLSYTILAISVAMLTYGIVIPLVLYTVRWIRALCHPITFPYKHVLITGCSSGLGKALVQEVFMKGAYITIIGRDPEKLKKVAESVDVSLISFISDVGQQQEPTSHHIDSCGHINIEEVGCGAADKECRGSLWQH